MSHFHAVQFKCSSPDDFFVRLRSIKCRCWLRAQLPFLTNIFDCIQLMSSTMFRFTQIALFSDAPQFIYFLGCFLNDQQWNLFHVRPVCTINTEMIFFSRSVGRAVNSSHVTATFTWRRMRQPIDCMTSNLTLIHFGWYFDICPL